MSNFIREKALIAGMKESLRSTPEFARFLITDENIKDFILRTNGRNEMTDGIQKALSTYVEEVHISLDKLSGDLQKWCPEYKERISYRINQTKQELQ